MRPTTKKDNIVMLLRSFLFGKPGDMNKLIINSKKIPTVFPLF